MRMDARKNKNLMTKSLFDNHKFLYELITHIRISAFNWLKLETISRKKLRFENGGRLWRDVPVYGVMIVLNASASILPPKSLLVVVYPVRFGQSDQRIINVQQ